MVNFLYNLKTIQIKITGLVQGVFFRQSTIDIARKLGLTGMVKNLKSGAVQIFVTGEQHQLDKLIQWCHHGPDQARVENVSVQEVDLMEFNGFKIDR